MTLRLAFVGAGYIARIHAQAARSLPEVELVAVADHRQETLEAFGRDFQIPRRYLSLEELLQAGGVDALIVATPNALHAPQSIAALQAGVHVMVEKPMALNAGEAEQMQAAAQASGASIMVAHCWRFDAEVRWLRQQVEAGRLGRIIRTKGYGVHVWWGPSGWFTEPALAGGGALVDMGIHAIDTARYLLGDPLPVRVYARLGTHYQSAPVDDTGLLLVTWDNQVESYIECGWWQPHSDGPEAATQLYGQAGFGQLFPTFLELPDLVAQQIIREESNFPHPRQPHCLQSMYDAQLAYFVDCLRRNLPPRPDAHDGWINQRLLDAAYQSARTGQAVNLTW